MTTNVDNQMPENTLKGKLPQVKNIYLTLRYYYFIFYYPRGFEFIYHSKYM